MLPKIPDSDFMVSPGDVKEIRKCVLASFLTSIKQPSLLAVRTSVTLNSLLWTYTLASVNLYHRGPTHYH